MSVNGRTAIDGTSTVRPAAPAWRERLELVAQVAGRGHAVAGLLLQAVAEEAVEGPGQAGVELDGRERLVLEDRGDPLGPRPAAEGEPARRPLEEDDAEREDVGAVVERLAPQLLRRHVGDRPGEVGVDRRRRPVVVPAEELGQGQEDPGQAEVQDLERPRRVDHDVHGLEVAVDDAPGVGGGDGVGQGHGDLEEAVERDAAGLDELRQGLAVDELHGEEARSLGLVDGEDGDDVGMAQGGDGLGLALEEGPPLGVGDGAAGQELDGHVAVELEVAGLPDDAHAALAELLDEAVVAEDEVFFELHRGSVPKDLTGIPGDRQPAAASWLRVSSSFAAVILNAVPVRSRPGRLRTDAG